MVIQAVIVVRYPQLQNDVGHVPVTMSELSELGGDGDEEVFPFNIDIEISYRMITHIFFNNAHIF